MCGLNLKYLAAFDYFFSFELITERRRLVLSEKEGEKM